MRCRQRRKREQKTRRKPNSFENFYYVFPNKKHTTNDVGGVVGVRASKRATEPRTCCFSFTRCLRCCCCCCCYYYFSVYFVLCSCMHTFLLFILIHNAKSVRSSLSFRAKSKYESLWKSREMNSLLPIITDCNDLEVNVVHWNTK